MLVLELDNEDEFEKVDDEEEERDVITVRELFARSIIFEKKRENNAGVGAEVCRSVLEAVDRLAQTSSWLPIA